MIGFKYHVYVSIIRPASVERLLWSLDSHHGAAPDAILTTTHTLAARPALKHHEKSNDG